MRFYCDLCINNYMEIIKHCKYCHVEFVPLTPLTKLCTSCKGTKQCSYQTITITECCKNCDYIFGTRSVNVTRKSSDTLRRIKVCATCREKNKVKRSLSKFGSNNPNSTLASDTKRKHFITIFDEETNTAVKKWVIDGVIVEPRKRKPKRIKETKNREEVLAVLKHRMVTNNPMHSLEVKQRAIQTKQQRIENGEIIFNRGSSHHLWKGNRNQSSRLRMFLHEWKMDNLGRAKFECELCTSKKYLEVHHLEPFHEIVSNHITKELSEYDIATQEFEELGQTIKEYHNNNDIGLVVCLDCHVKIDKHRHYSLPHYVYKKYQKD